jgi:hypothetical protein
MNPIHITHANLEQEYDFMSLQASNLVVNLPIELHAGGFVTTPFTNAQYAQLVSEQRLVVALADDKIVGYVISADWNFLKQYPIFAYMIELLPSLSIDGVHMSENNSYQYGPVCIDEQWRGKNILPQLFEFAKKHMSTHYPYGLTFINSRNQRSKQAHLHKLNLEHITDFNFNDQNYHLLGFKTN